MGRPDGDPGRGATMDPVLSARNLGASFEGEWVFRSWDVSISRGERIALLGRSGCGKTTFLRIAAGLAWGTSSRSLG